MDEECIFDDPEFAAGQCIFDNQTGGDVVPFCFGPVDDSVIETAQSGMGYYE